MFLHFHSISYSLYTYITHTYIHIFLLLLFFLRPVFTFRFLHVSSPYPPNSTIVSVDSSSSDICSSRDVSFCFYYFYRMCMPYEVVMGPMMMIMCRGVAHKMMIISRINLAGCWYQCRDAGFWCVFGDRIEQNRVKVGFGSCFDKRSGRFWKGHKNKATGVKIAPVKLANKLTKGFFCTDLLLKHWFF